MMDKNELKPYQLSTTWVEDLALEEINMEESGIINFNGPQSAESLLENESIELMNSIRDLFEIYIARFNELRGQEGSNGKMVKIFKISNTVNDFMLFRNSLKLIVARKAPDCISIGLLTNTGAFYSPRINENTLSEQKVHELRAHLGAFNHITWQFQGEEVEIGALVKHYLSEFIRLSAR